MTSKSPDGARPVTPVELDLIRLAVSLRLPASQPHRRRHLKRLRQMLSEQGEQLAVSERMIRFVARMVWAYRKSPMVPANMAVLAALKGGTEPSPWQIQAAKKRQQEELRFRHVEDPLPDGELPF